MRAAKPVHELLPERGATLFEQVGANAQRAAADDADVLVPGHGSVGGADQGHARIDQDRAYVHALRDAGVPSDPRIGPSATYGTDWLPGVHERRLQRLARRSERNGTPG